MSMRIASQSIFGICNKLRGGSAVEMGDSIRSEILGRCKRRI